jgi:hypothetical protein
VNLREIVFGARGRLKDQGMKRWRDPELVLAANEAKNELVKIIRQSKRDYFTTASTFSISPAPAQWIPTGFVLPDDFSQLKDIQITDAGYEWIQFVHIDMADPRFKQMIETGGSFASGEGFFYYDIAGRESVIVAPSPDIVLNGIMYYSQTVPDMAFPTDEPTGIPIEHQDFIVNFIVCECLRETNDPQLSGYLDKLEKQREMLLESLADQQVREPQFVRGFMEGEW